MYFRFNRKEIIIGTQFHQMFLNKRFSDNILSTKKITKPNCKHRIRLSMKMPAQNTFEYENADCKMLVKLTPRERHLLTKSLCESRCSESGA